MTDEMTTDLLDETTARATLDVGELVRSLLIDTDLDYDAILAEVRKAIPDAKTTVRSIASVASIARKRGEAVAMRAEARSTRAAEEGGQG
jgi:hypothetical protein